MIIFVAIKASEELDIYAHELVRCSDGSSRMVLIEKLELVIRSLSWRVSSNMC